MSSIGIVILAAGASTRMGTPKQLLRYAGQTLLRRAAETAIAAPCRPVVVVLGANAERMLPELTGLPIHTVENTHWEEGMGSSLRIGLQALLTNVSEEIEAVVFMLCDQPFVTADTLNTLIDTFTNQGTPVIASTYGGITGVPALFHRSLFPELLQLQGVEGAKKVIERHLDKSTSIPFPEGGIDIDTPDDYTELQQQVKQGSR